MPTSDPERVDTKQKIMDAALILFRSQGYHGTSMRQIANAAGIVPGALYNHFAGKQDLYLALLHDANIYAALADALHSASGDSAEALLRDAAHRMLDALQARRDTVPIFLVDALEFEGRNLEPLARAAMPEVLPFINRVAASGALRQVRADVLLRAFVGLLMSYFMTSLFMRPVLSQIPGLDLQADVLDDLLDIFAHGVLLPDGPGDPPAGLC
jgi:AcrR family transcriptional regulator